MLDEIKEIKLKKLINLRQSGMEAYPEKTERSMTNQKALAGFEALQEKAKKMKKDLNLQDGITVLFVSEPLSTAQHVDMGFTEQTILRDLIDEICHVCPSETVNLLVKLHPKQQPEKVRHFISSFAIPKNIRLSLIADFPVLPLILIADMVIGIQSTVLIEANLLKKPIMSLQIGRKSPDQFILSKRGIVEAITTRDVLKQELRRVFFREGKKPQQTLPVIPHPIENVKRFIISVFNQQ